jgi:D-ribose pyranase
MKKGRILNQPLNAVIADMGHTDLLTVVDCGYPIPQGAPRIDLALTRGTPGFLETLDAILEDLCVEKVTIASEIVEQNRELYQALQERFASLPIEMISHEQLKEAARPSKSFVRTGESKPYANIILHSGVSF